MKLKDFPLIMWGFQQIEYDSRGFRSRLLKGEAEVSDYWLPAFRAAENTLHRCGNLTAKDVPELKEKEAYHDSNGAFTYLKDVVVLPVDDDDWVVYRHLGVDEAQGWVTSRVFYEFFDGELSQTYV